MINISILKKALFVGLFLSIFSNAVISGPVNCGANPIKLSFFDFGLFYFEENGQGKGISRDVIDALIKRTDCEFITQVIPRARTWHDLSTGNLDMTVDGISNQERKNFGWFIPYNKIKNYALINAEIEKSVQGLNSFRDQPQLMFGVVRSFNHGNELESWLDQMRIEKRVEESANIDILFNKFMLGRIDAMFAPPAVYRKFLHDLKIENNVAIQDWAPDDKGIIASLVLAKSRFSEADAKDWAHLIMQMRLDGTFKHIFSQYLSKNDANWMADF